MRWDAHTHSTEVRRGTRIYVLEALETEGVPRPPYAPGDPFRLSTNNNSRSSGTIVSVSGRELVVDLPDLGAFTLSPTPADLGPPSLETSMSMDDFIVV